MVDVKNEFEAPTQGPSQAGISSPAPSHEDRVGVDEDLQGGQEVPVQGQDFLLIIL